MDPYHFRSRIQIRIKGEIQELFNVGSKYSYGGLLLALTAQA
jgi:hypothetical protein